VSASDSADPFLVSAWGVALDDAGLDSDDFYLLPCRGRAVDLSPRAAWYPPGWVLPQEDLLVRDVLDEANEPSHREKHRVAIFEDVNEDDPVEIAIVTPSSDTRSSMLGST